MPVAKHVSMFSHLPRTSDQVIFLLVLPTSTFFTCHKNFSTKEIPQEYSLCIGACLGIRLHTLSIWMNDTLRYRYAAFPSQSTMEKRAPIGTTALLQEEMFISTKRTNRWILTSMPIWTTILDYPDQLSSKEEAHWSPHPCESSPCVQFPRDRCHRHNLASHQSPRNNRAEAHMQTGEAYGIVELCVCQDVLIEKDHRRTHSYPKQCVQVHQHYIPPWSLLFLSLSSFFHILPLHRLHTCFPQRQLSQVPPHNTPDVFTTQMTSTLQLQAPPSWRLFGHGSRSNGSPVGQLPQAFLSWPLYRLLKEAPRKNHLYVLDQSPTAVILKNPKPANSRATLRPIKNYNLGSMNSNYWVITKD